MTQNIKHYTNIHVKSRINHIKFPKNINSKTFVIYIIYPAPAR